MRAVLTTLIVAMLVCPVVEAGIGGRLSALRTRVQQGVAALGTGATMVIMCFNMLSCSPVDKQAGRVWQRDSENVLDGLPIMQGATTTDQTQIFVLTEDGDDYVFSLRDGHGKEIEPAALEVHGYPSSPHVVQRVLFQGLTAGTPYTLLVRSSTNNTLLDVRELQTLVAAKQDLCFAVASCMLDIYPRQEDIWEQMVARNPDVIFFVGDNVYADIPARAKSPADLWDRYVYTRQTLDIFRSQKLIPIIATWDDHDYGLNNSDRNYEFKHAARDIFETFFVSDSSEKFHPSGLGVASLFEIYGYSFFLMDNRTFRSPPLVSPQHHFGEAQMQWLLSSLPGREHAFIASGDQFFGGYSHVNNDKSILASESFQGDHPQRFAYFLTQLQAIDTEVVFLSGDRHYAEIMAIPTEMLGYRTYEFTSSPISNFNTPISDVPNPLRVASHDSDINFMLMKAKESGDALVLDATAYGSGGKVLFTGIYRVE